MCNSCHVRFSRKATGVFEESPYNLAVQQFEDRHFTHPGTGVQQTRKGNAYILPCIHAMHHQELATASSLVIEESVRSKLDEEQKLL